MQNHYSNFLPYIILSLSPDSQNDQRPVRTLSISLVFCVAKPVVMWFEFEKILLCMFFSMFVCSFACCLFTKIVELLSSFVYLFVAFAISQEHFGCRAQVDHNAHVSPSQIAKLMGTTWGPPGPWFNIKMSSYQYRKSHCGDKAVVRSSYLHNGISYTGKTIPLYWIGAMGPVGSRWKFCCLFILRLYIPYS